MQANIALLKERVRQGYSLVVFPEAGVTRFRLYYGFIKERST